MKFFLVIAILLLTVGSITLPSAARTQSAADETASLSAQSAIVDPEAQSISLPGKVVDKINAASETVSSPAVVVMADTSLSVKRQWSDLKNAAKSIVGSVPNNALVGVVGIDAEASKSELYPSTRRNEAVKFIDGLAAKGRYTDLARGMDASLSMLQESGAARGVIICLTDGELDVPKDFKDRRDFISLLKREFSSASRKDIAVIILNAGGRLIKDRNQLPANITIIPLESWKDAQPVLEKILAPMLGEKLSTESAARAAAQQRPSGMESEPKEPSFTNFYAAAALLVLGLIARAVYRTKRGRAEKRIIQTAPPENLMRPEDLAPKKEPIAEPIAVLTVERRESETGRRAFYRRGYIKKGDELVLGGSSFCDLPLEGLKQARTVQINFDGERLEVFRLSPQTAGDLDAVRFDGIDAPIRFMLREGSEFEIGAFTIKSILSDESALRVFINKESRSKTFSEGERRLTRRFRTGRNYGTEN